MKGTEGLLGLLAVARRRWRTLLLLKGGLASLALASSLLLLLLSAGWLGLVPDPARPLLRWIPILAVLFPLGVALFHGITHAPNDRALALRAEEVASDLAHLPTVLLDRPPGHPYAPELHRQIRGTACQHQ